MKQLQLPLGPGVSRRQKGLDQFCLYCGRPADTREHVPPKTLLEKPWPINLRTVPACGPCNRSWSLDEEYLAVVLAHVGDAPHLAAKIEDGGKFDRSLQSFPGLDDRIIKSLSIDSEGRVRFEPEMGRIATVVEKVAFGLYALKYGRGASRSDFACIAVAGPGAELPPNLVPALWIWPGIRRKRWTPVQDSVFSFLFAKGWLAGDAPLYCFMNLHNTLIAVVSCPAAATRAKARLASAPW
ncbi:MAG TPA: hypothetical protein VJP88_10260 [Caulobacteraceae bacterium]|nr:hypothetical protein [Caulobacteraceae bacterium]